MHGVHEVKLTDVYEGWSHAYLLSLKAGGLADFYVPPGTLNWPDYRATGDSTDGVALTTNTFGVGIHYGNYVYGAAASAYALDNSLSILHFISYGTYGEHVLKRWDSHNGMSGATPLATVNLVHAYSPIVNGQEGLVWIATDDFLITAKQWDVVTQREMHVLERFVENVLSWSSVELQETVYTPMLPPNKFTSTFLNALSREYRIIVRGKCGILPTTLYGETPYYVIGTEDNTPDEFMVQVSTEYSFATDSLIQTHVFSANEAFTESGFNQIAGSTIYLYILKTDSPCLARDSRNAWGLYVYITEGAGAGQSQYISEISSYDANTWRLHVRPIGFSVPLDVTSKWEFRFKQTTRSLIVPQTGTYAVRITQRKTGTAWGLWTTMSLTGTDVYTWEFSEPFYSDIVYESHGLLGTTSGWAIALRNRDWAAYNWRIQCSVSSDFSDNPMPLEVVGVFPHYIAGGQPLHGEAVLYLVGAYSVPASGWYIRARGESSDGIIVSAWTESLFVKAGEANGSKSYSTYVPSYVGTRTANICLGIVVAGTKTYSIFQRYVFTVANQVETNSEEKLLLLPASTSNGAIEAEISVVSAVTGYYQPSFYSDGTTVFIAYYVDATHLYWKSYNTATSTLSAEHTVVLPAGYTALGYGTIWQPGGLLFTAVFNYGPPSIAHLAYVDTAVSDTLQVLTNTHADDGTMQGSAKFGFWYPFVTDYDAYVDYGIAFLAADDKVHFFSWVDKFKLCKVL